MACWDDNIKSATIRCVFATVRMELEIRLFLLHLIRVMKHKMCVWIILSMHPANERLRYIVTSYLIGWAHTKNDPCLWSGYNMVRFPLHIHNKPHRGIDLGVCYEVKIISSITARCEISYYNRPRCKRSNYIIISSAWVLLLIAMENKCSHTASFSNWNKCNHSTEIHCWIYISMYRAKMHN